MKQIELHQNSWHTKYYKWITRNNPPNGLCPYFWSMVAFVLLSPIIIPIVSFVKFLIYLTERNMTAEEKLRMQFARERKREQRRSDPSLVNWMDIWGNVGKILLGIILMFLIFCVMMLFVGISNQIGTLNLVLILLAIFGGFFILFLILFVWTESHIGEKIANSKIITVPRAAIVGFYKKRCPRINWINTNTRTDENVN
jgi:hypothetical protein